MTSYDITKFNKFLHVGPIGCPWVIPYVEAVLEVLDSIAPKDRHKAARNNCFFMYINFPSSLDFRRMEPSVDIMVHSLFEKPQQKTRV